MQTQNTFIEDLKHQYKYGGMTIRLIFINVILFLGVRIISVFAGLSGSNSDLFIAKFITPIFGLHTDLLEFITHPWTLLTSMFMHYGAWHLIWNMVFLYFAGKLFEQLFDQKRLLYTYILGGIFGGLLEIIAHLIFRKLQLTDDIVIGASGAIMAVFVSIAFHRPNLKVNLFGILPVRLIILAGIFILMDLLNLDKADGTAHFAHLGGAILGFISIQNLHSSSNIVNAFQIFMQRISGLFDRKNRTPRMKVKKGGNARMKTDEEYNEEAKFKQEKTDAILDKISKSGYESLSKKEKDFLFNQSKK